MQLIRHWLLGLGFVWFQANSLLAFTQEVYVWQRQFSPAIYQAIEVVHRDVSGIAVLAAEISWEKKQPRLFRSSVNYATLAANGCPVGLVLRIGPYAGRYSADDETARYLTDVAINLLRSARSGGVEPTELQVDFDCASSKLAGYRLWLDALRIAVAPMKITFTALPDWLGRENFPALARAADGYILQVHSLEKPAGVDEVFQLCDPDRALRWVAQAERIGLPFRVALPTYGYRLAFNATGQFIALAAEGPLPHWPAGTQVHTVRADESAVAGLARKLVEIKPAGCAGIIWFRLPVAGDQLNWAIATLKVVLHGGLPVAQLEVEVSWPLAGLAEVSVVNRGEQNALPPAKVIAQWSGEASVLTADGLRGYALAASPLKSGVIAMTAAPTVAEERIAPGRRRKIGWIRFSHETSLTAQIVTSP